MEGFYEFEHREVQKLTLKERFGSKGSDSVGSKGKTTVRQGFAIQCADEMSQCTNILFTDRNGIASVLCD